MGGGGGLPSKKQNANCQVHFILEEGGSQRWAKRMSNEKGGDSKDTKDTSSH